MPSLILSALLSAPLDCISAAVPQCRCAMHLPVVRNGRALRVTLCTRERGRLEQSPRSPSMKHNFLSLSLLLLLSLSISLFAASSIAGPRLHLHFNKRREKRTVRRAFSLARRENEGTGCASRQRRGLSHNYVKAFHAVIKRKDAPAASQDVSSRAFHYRIDGDLCERIRVAGITSRCTIRDEKKEILLYLNHNEINK